NEVDPELLSALQKLPGVFLHPLLLREIEDLSYTDIASVLSVPVGTVMSRLYRARHLLRAALENAPDGSSKKPGGKGTSASKESSKQTSKE
ncbi:sigma factor-like helix-turn-helix DNA-binding protein, partial [Acinetobacter baumannii]